MHARTAAALGAGVFLLYASALRPIMISPDERSMLAVALAIAEGSVAVPASMGSVGLDGRTYSNWYPLASIIALPAVIAGRATTAITGLPALYTTAPLAIATMALVSAGGAVAVWLLAGRLGVRETMAVGAGIAYAIGTVVLLYSRTFFADSLLATIVVAAACWALDERPGASWKAGAFAALAVLAKPTGIVVGSAIALWHLIGGEWRRAAHAGFGTALGLALYGWYNWVRFGDPATFGQKWSGFTTCCVPEALAGMLVSPGRGLFVYSPVVLIGAVSLALAWRRPSAKLLALLVGGFLAIHSVWGEWVGGWSWGSRLLLPAVGLLCAATALAPAAIQRALPVAVAAGVVINAPTLFWSYQQYIEEAYERGVSDDELIWDWRHAQIRHAWPSAIASVARARQSDVREVVAAAGQDDRGSRRAEVFRIVPVWWWLSPILGIPRWVSGAFAAILALAGLALLSVAVRGTRPAPIQPLPAAPIP
jgi:hypothetical protein